MIAAAPELAGENTQDFGAVAHVAPNKIAHDVVVDDPIVIFPTWSTPDIVPFVPDPQAPDDIVGVPPEIEL